MVRVYGFGIAHKDGQLCVCAVFGVCLHGQVLAHLQRNSALTHEVGINCEFVQCLVCAFRMLFTHLLWHPGECKEYSICMLF